MSSTPPPAATPTPPATPVAPPPATPATPTPPVTSVAPQLNYLQRAHRTLAYILAALAINLKLIYPVLFSYKLAGASAQVLTVSLIIACLMLARQPRSGIRYTIGIWVVFVGGIVGLLLLK
jgi:hypothetical protein